MKKIIGYAVFFLSPALIKLESYLSLFEILNKQNKMTSLEILELIALPFLFLGVFIYFDNRFKKQKNYVIRYIDKIIEYDRVTNEMLGEVTKRRLKYLYISIVKGKALPDKSKWLTKYEIKLLEEKSEKFDFELSDLQKKLDYYFLDEEKMDNQ